jgi:CDP-diacylglycerol---glycerol-3-phosphate 3-phosphatidyltransferase
MEGSSAIRSADVNEAGVPAASLTLDSPGRQSYLRSSLANAITFIRLVSIAPFAFFMAHGGIRYAEIALVIFIIALATDFADGPTARRLGTVTPIGGTFDHTVDFLFVTSGLFAGTSRGIFPWILPALIVAAFAQYFIDSYWIHRHGRLRKSKLGRYNGILYFVPLSLAILIRLGAHLLQPLLTVLVWALVASTIVSIGQRLTFSIFSEKFASGSPEK